MQQGAPFGIEVSLVTRAARLPALRCAAAMRAGAAGKVRAGLRSLSDPGRQWSATGVCRMWKPMFAPGFRSAPR
jgi:hypothetical protein